MTEPGTDVSAYRVQRGEMIAEPAALVQVFGLPTRDDFDLDCLGAYYFRGPTGQRFALHFLAHNFGWWALKHLKASFWAETQPRTFGIGSDASDDIDAFKAFVRTALGKR